LLVIVIGGTVGDPASKKEDSPAIKAIESLSQ